MIQAMNKILVIKKQRQEITPKISRCWKGLCCVWEEEERRLERVELFEASQSCSIRPSSSVRAVTAVVFYLDSNCGCRAVGRASKQGGQS